MIVQETSNGLLLFRQTDHALLSGAFARAWGNDRFPDLARRDATLVAASRHDDGWAEWELAPKLLANGAPVDFVHVPVADHVPLYKRGIDLVKVEDPYAGLVASLHGERLYTRPFHPGMDPRIEHLSGDDLHLATDYVDGERDRQTRLSHTLGEDALDDAEESWRLLQVWDRLSLLVCMRPVGPGAEQTLPAVATVDGDVRITATAADVGVLALDPYPFARHAVAFDVPAVRTEALTWPDEACFRRDFRTAEHVVVTFSCCSTQPVPSSDGP